MNVCLNCDIYILLVSKYMCVHVEREQKFRKNHAVKSIVRAVYKLHTRNRKSRWCDKWEGRPRSVVFGAGGQSTERQFLELFSSSRRSVRP